MTNEDEISGNEETNHPTLRRSKEASEKLVNLDHSNIVEYDWIFNLMCMFVKQVG